MMMMARDLFIFIRYSPDSGSILSRVIAADNRFGSLLTQLFYIVVFPQPTTHHHGNDETKATTTATT